MMIDRPSLYDVKDKTILLYSAHGLMSTHLGHELELIHQLKDKNTIHMVQCDASLDFCFTNPCHNLIGCAICKSRSTQFYGIAGMKADNIHAIEEYVSKNEIIIPEIFKTEDLYDYSYDGINIGLGIVSSLISIQRDFDITTDKYKTEIEKLALSGINGLLSFKKVAEKINPDFVIFFNGRFAESRPVFNYCSLKKIKFYTLEKVGVKNKYALNENHLPHAIEERLVQMRENWESSTQTNKIELAQNWFNRRKDGKPLTGISFLDNQKKHSLPTDFDKQKTNIVIFNSSEDEFKSIPEWQNDMFNSQDEVIRKIMDHFSNIPDLHFYLRVHPNLGRVDNSQTRDIDNLDYKNLTIIDPNNKVDSYYLLENCNKIITFGSTIGIEATFWGKVSIMFGNSFYQSMDAVYEPKSYEELFELIKLKNLEPKLKSNTYPHALFLINRGYKSEYFREGSKNQDTFLGKKIGRFYFSTFINFFRYLNQLPIWIKNNKLLFGNAWRKNFFTKLKPK